MRPPLKLSSIDQEHLQELYNSAGVARDELPYSEAFEEIWKGFQDRTFKNAERDQLFAALLKYTRSSTNASTVSEPVAISDDQRKQLKSLLPRHAAGGKLLPYSEEFDAARKEFNSHSGMSLTERDFWRALSGGQSGRRKPPVRRPAKAAAAATEVEDEDEGE